MRGRSSPVRSRAGQSPVAAHGRQTHPQGGSMAGRRRSVRGWAALDDERLLDLRFRDLDVDVRGSTLEPLVRTMWDELAERGLRVKPHVWPSTEWFSPDGVPGIAAP